MHRSLHHTEFATGKELILKAALYTRLASCGLHMATWLYAAYAWLLFILAFLTAGTLISLLQTPRLGRRIARAASNAMYFLGGVPLMVQGLEDLPPGPHILLVNHSSFVDGLALSALLPPVPGYAFVVRQQYASQALFYPLLKGLGTVVLERHGDPGAHATRHPNIEKLVAALLEGRNLLLFPEGGFRPEPGLLPFHLGAFIASVRTGIPVTVAVLNGAREAMRPGTWRPRRTRLRLTIGPTLKPQGIDENAARVMQERAHDLMQALTERAAKA